MECEETGVSTQTDEPETGTSSQTGPSVLILPETGIATQTEEDPEPETGISTQTEEPEPETGMSTQTEEPETGMSTQTQGSGSTVASGASPPAQQHSANLPAAPADPPVVKVGSAPVPVYESKLQPSGSNERESSAKVSFAVRALHVPTHWIVLLRVRFQGPTSLPGR